MDTLTVKLIAAVMANVEANPDGSLKLNVSVAKEMVENLLMAYQIKQIKGR